ncbi:MAG: hypothetical protein K2X64_01785 [Rhodocyclaceae bacterium]|nr:hypothetical protein [Rhodocyclaceae bacterium]
MSTLFQRYIGIDYSGAATSQTGLSGLRVFVAVGSDAPQEIRNPSRPSGHWSREALAHWVRDRLREPVATVVGVDHGFAFPQAYFDLHGVPTNWHVFLDDFCQHWPTDAPGVSVRDVRAGRVGAAAARGGDSRWRRTIEQRCAAKSVFHFDVPGSVASSTHAGLPWLRWLLQQVPELHCWPFDGWAIPVGRSVICEAYPALVSHRYPNTFAKQDQHDAYALCRWLAEADQEGALHTVFAPVLSSDEAERVAMEGWILGYPQPS